MMKENNSSNFCLNGGRGGGNNEKNYWNRNLRCLQGFLNAVSNNIAVECAGLKGSVTKLKRGMPDEKNDEQKGDFIRIHLCFGMFVHDGCAGKFRWRQGMGI